MKYAGFIIAALLLIATIWRAPAIYYIPTSTGIAPAAELRLDFENVFTWSAVSLLAAYIAYSVNPWWGLFLLLATFSAWFPVNSDASERASRFVLYGAIWYALCVHFFREKANRQWAVNAICVIALANVVMLVMQGFFSYDPLHRPLRSIKWASVPFDTSPNIGLMSCYNGVAAMLAICMPAFLGRHNLYLIAIPVLFVGFGLAHTFAGPLVGVLILIAYAIERVPTIWGYDRKVIIRCTVGASFLTLLVYYALIDKPDLVWRWEAWKLAFVPDSWRHYLVGAGIGHWKIVYGNIEKIINMTGQNIMAQAHNEYVQGLFEMGIMFPILVLGYFVDIFRRYQREAFIPLLAVAAAALNSLVFFPFHIGLSALVAVTWMAMLESTLRPRSGVSFSWLRLPFLRAQQSSL